MIIESQEDVTRAVLGEMHRTPDPRTHEILAALLEFTFVLEQGEARRPKAPITQKVSTA